MDLNNVPIIVLLVTKTSKIMERVQAYQLIVKEKHILTTEQEYVVISVHKTL
jgi:hypothetical protein